MAKAKEKVLDIRSHQSLQNGQTAAVRHSLKIRLDDMKTFDALTDNQGIFYDQWKNNHIIAHVLTGSSGTGKSFISAYRALEMVLDKGNPYKKLVIVRSSAQSRDQGFLPGGKNEKMEAFEAPYIGMVAKMFNHGVGGGQPYERLKEQGYIEFVSTSFLRGETFSDCIILFDEIQNTTEVELETVVTRVGENCRIIMCGDTAQTDLKKEKSGFAPVMKVLKKMKEVSFIEFGVEDIVRSGFVKSYLTKKYEMQ